MNLGFKNRFVEYVREGSKRHTIREGDRWRPGMRADLFENPRQPKKFNEEGIQIAGMQLIFRSQCTAVQPIKITRQEFGIAYNPGVLIVETDGELLAPDEANGFFWRDGFRPEPGDPFSSMSMAAAFWRKQIRLKPFTGQIVHWDYEARRMEK